MVPFVDVAGGGVVPVVDVAGGAATAGVTFGVGNGTDSETYGNSVTVGCSMPFCNAAPTMRAGVSSSATASSS